MPDNTQPTWVPAASSRALTVLGEFLPNYGAYVPPAPEDDGIPLSHYFWVLKRKRWAILIFVSITVAVTLGVSSQLTPYYESTATVDIDRQMPSGVIGEDASARTAIDDSDQYLATQVRIIQSDSVLRPVIERLGISTEIQAQKQDALKAGAADAPVALPRLKIARLPNTYLLLVTYRSPNPQLAAAVANNVVQSYIRHAYNLRFQASAGLSNFMEKQTEEFKRKMEKSSADLVQFEKDLNVIDPEAKTSILSARLLQLNSEFTSAQTSRLAKQAAYRSVQDGSLETAEASEQGDQLRKLAERIDDARMRFASVRQFYGDNHPEYKKASSEMAELERQVNAVKENIGRRVQVEYQQAVNRENMLKDALAETKKEFDGLNAHSFDYKALKQEADSDKKVYDQMITKIEEAGINANFQSNSIRLADPARPALRPVSPNLPLNALMALLGSALMATFAAIAIDHMDQTVRDPEQIQRILKTTMIGSLPLVTVWKGRTTARSGRPSRSLLSIGTGLGPATEFEEAIRTLRDSILLPAGDQPPRSILFTSSTPREGKTTTALHFAVAHSKQKRRTLIIDGDTRRPGVHQHIGVANDIGLSNVVDDELPWRDAVTTSESFPNLSVLPAGPHSTRAMDCFGATLYGILAEATKEYDLVVLDSPPVLGFAEPLQMASLVDGVVVVTLSNQTNRTAVASTLGGLRRVRANVLGIALNGIPPDVNNRYHYHGHHGDYYSRYYQRTQG